MSSIAIIVICLGPLSLLRGWVAYNLEQVANGEAQVGFFKFIDRLDSASATRLLVLIKPMSGKYKSLSKQHHKKVFIATALTYLIYALLLSILLINVID